MSRIDQLIAERVPLGVPYKRVSDVATYVRGVTYGKDDEQADGPVHVLRSNNITLSSNTLNFDDVKTVAGIVRVRPDQRLRANDILISAASGSRAHVGKVAYVSEDIDYCFGSFMAVLRVSEQLDSRFLFHLLTGQTFSQYLDAKLTSTTIRNLNSSTMGGFLVPVPPLDVQREIVRILDKFTALEAELNAELEMRKQQRFALARTFLGAPYGRAPDGGVLERVPLGEVATQYVEPLRVRSGVTYTNLGVKWYGEGVFARESKLGNAIKGTTLYRVKPRQFIFNRMFVTEGSFAVIAPELAEGVVSNEFPVYELDTARVLPEWLLAYFQDEYTLKRIEGEVTGTERGSTKSRRRWKENQFEAFHVELPSVDDQREFLRVIGTIAGLESALSDELVARRQQYGFYRDKLLTFEEAAA